MIYRACRQFDCEPWQLSAKRLAWWNRRHGFASRSRNIKRQRELRRREVQCSRDEVLCLDMPLECMW
jgi:hypothetical protein